MTNQQHPITPPDKLVQQWHTEWFQSKVKHVGVNEYIATQAARWGDEQRFQACLQLLDINGCPNKWLDMLRAAMRPEPPSLAEQATTELQSHVQELRVHGLGWNAPTISAALERLKELENGNE